MPTILVLSGASVLVAFGVSSMTAYGAGALAAPPSNVFLLAGTLGLASTSADSDATIDFESSSSTYTVTDHDGVVADGGCTQVDPKTVSCSAGHPALSVSWRGGDGDDRLTLSADVPGRLLGDGGDGDDLLRLENGSSAVARLFGRTGQDTFIGGSREDSLIGHQAKDKLKGNAGDDVLTGGAQADVLLGGGGDDVLRARAEGQDRDRVIDCGPGDDVAKIDRGIDPVQLGCERVIRRR